MVRFGRCLDLCLEMQILQTRKLFSVLLLFYNYWSENSEKSNDRLFGVLQGWNESAMNPPNQKASHTNHVLYEKP